MEWYQVLMIILSVFGMGWVMFYNLGSKINQTDEKLSERTREIIKEIRDSNLDFHGRLSRLEGKEERK
jgi:hypothetical protein